VIDNRGCRGGTLIELDLSAGGRVLAQLRTGETPVAVVS
jgi:hypothetical protein